jgi:Flp pilus assembly pilin Flp
MNRMKPRVRALHRDTRGASMVEYALLLGLVLVTVAPAVRALGSRVLSGFTAAVALFGP